MGDAVAETVGALASRLLLSKPPLKERK
jgi:hypothetical protein